MTNVSLPLPNNGYFIARSDTVGATDDELKECFTRTLDEQRQTQIARSTVQAMDLLRGAKTEGKC